MERIIYLANMRMPTERAHGIQVAKTCEALAHAGAEVTLVVPARKTSIAEDVFSYYGLTQKFKIVRLPVLDAIRFGSFGFFIESISFGITALCYCLVRKGATVYSRDELSLWIISLFLKKCVWESHTGRCNVWTTRLLARGKKCVVISNGLKELYEKRGAQAAFLVAHDAVDLTPFEKGYPKREARSRLGLPQDKTIALYAGTLDGWKGVEVLLEASRNLPQEFLVAVIGGDEAQVQRLSQAYPQVIFLGARPYTELPQNEAAADVLVLPNTGKDLISARYTSPMKLFAYMAAGVPIVVSDLPSMREILNEKNAIFFEADNPSALAGAVTEAAKPAALALGGQAKRDVMAYTWNARANAIINFLNS